MGLSEKIKKVSVFQHDTSDCGAACMVSAIGYFGGQTSGETIRKLSGTTSYGTTMLGLLQAAQKCGLDATGYEAGVNDIVGYDGVLILHVKPGPQLEHYVVCFGQEKGKFIIWDPSRGLENLSEDELDRLWDSKKCLGLRPNGAFKYKKLQKEQVLSWLKQIIHPDRSLLAASLAVGMIVSVLGLVMAVFTQKLIDTILPAKNINLLVISVVLVFILLTARILLNAVRQQVLVFQGKTFNIRVIDNFFGALMYLPQSFFDTRKTGDFVGRLNDTMRIQRVIAEFVSVYIIDLLVLLISVTALFFYCEVSAFITIITIPILFLLVYRWHKRIISAQHDVMAGYALSESNFIDSIQGISDLRSLGWQESFTGRNKKIYSDFQEKAYSLGRIKISLGILTGIAGTFYLASILLYISMQVLSTRMSEGELLAVLTISSSVVPSILNLSLIAIPVSEARVAVERMFEFSLTEPEGEEISGVTHLTGIKEISLEKVSFRYPGRPLLIKNIELSVNKGSITSLVGESGCGKSTLAGIMMRYFEPEEGSLSINGVNDARSIAHGEWRSAVGIVPQEIHIFNGTILQNLTSDLSEGGIKELAAAITTLGLDKFIDAFPAGIMTRVGEDGINLSGGQRQLIGFIRALIRKPEILIIDEGTSNMDRSTETTIANLLVRLKKDMGILLISHRINLIRELSDRIYVMENSIITAQGTHSGLMKYDNLYKRYWDDFI